MPEIARDLIPVTKSCEAACGSELKRRLRAFGAPILAVLLVLGGQALAGAAPRETTVRTIQDLDGDNRLEFGPGEDYLVVEGTEGFRPPKDGSILNFLQLTDFQLVDEESPARVEFLDPTQRSPGSPFKAAYRPMESLTTQVEEAMVRAAGNAVSPVTGEPLDLTLLTGDNADNQQFNETRWFIDILDGHVTIDPNSGVFDPLCPGNPTSIYDGMRGGGSPLGYYDPDRSGSNTDGDGYSPERGENAAKTGRDVTVRDFPELFEDANQPFRAIGVDMPWYSGFGNHDALIQGNSPDAYVGPIGPSGEVFDPKFQSIAVGCLKPRTDAELQALLQGDQSGMIVPPDPRRCLLAKDEPVIGAPPPCGGTSWILEHFDTSGTPVGHGFAPAVAADQAALGRPFIADANNDGYYSFSPVPGLRFVVLDSVTDECGTQFCFDGSIDDPQFQWLRDQIQTAASLGEYVIASAHHSLRTMRLPSTDPSEQPIHQGQRVDRTNPGNPQGTGAGTTLEELFCLHDNVLAFVAGHEHENRIHHHACGRDVPPTAGGGDFWEISTAAHIDWPQQSRMIELVDNGDRLPGTMSLVLTILDHAGPPNPGGAQPTLSARGHAGEQVLRLASIARELAYNDYQADRGARGSRQDRNVIIVLDRPWPHRNA